MEANGWVFENLTSNISHCMPSISPVHRKCGGKNGTHWYGWGCGNNVGSISTSLKGSGTVSLHYGNCWNEGNVIVYLNNVEISRSSPGTSQVYRIPYNDGNELKIMDENGNAIIKIVDITFTCKGKYLKNKDLCLVIEKVLLKPFIKKNLKTYKNYAY